MPDIPEELVGHLTTVLARDHKCDRYGNARGCRTCERRARLVAEAVLPDVQRQAWAEGYKKGWHDHPEWRRATDNPHIGEEDD